MRYLIMQNKNLPTKMQEKEKSSDRKPLEELIFEGTFKEK